MNGYRWPGVCPTCGSRHILTRQTDGDWLCCACGSQSAGWRASEGVTVESLPACFANDQDDDRSEVMA